MREVQVRNRQRAERLNSELLRRIVRSLLEEELKLDRYELAIHFVSAGRMATINQHFLKHKGSTDVITFDYREGYEEAVKLDVAGEIYISVADAFAQAREFKTNWQEEIVRYAIHGVLHLRGYDDLTPGKRTVMKREENRLLRKLKGRFPLRQIRV
jgi:probable rRNA maturation factor